MKLLEGRIAVVTGAGRGLGRGHAIMLAKHGAKVVVNDLGGSTDGIGNDSTPAEEVVAAVRAAGGEAVADYNNVATWDGAKALIDKAVETYGGLDILINNAGILRDRMLVNMTEAEWDSVINVHLKGTFAPTHHAANYWRQQSKEGKKVDARVINTSSHSGLFGNIGQVNYAAAKAGIASFTIVAARELQRYGVTVNALAPRAQTRMTEGLREWEPEELERRNPEWIASLVAYLSSSQAHDISGRVFEAWGFGYTVAEGWQHGATTDATKDPNTLDQPIREILKASKKNAGIDPGTWLDV